MFQKPCLHVCTWLASTVLLGTFAAASNAAEPAAGTAQAAPSRPRIGLVLAGGGAKGGAHVGVLKVMEELHVPVDCIAGTSMGALVGAGYASGIPAAELETFVTGIDWKSVVGGMGQRDLQPVEQKRAAETYSNNLEVGIKDGGVVLPGGIVDTAGIENLLRSYVARARMQSNFDHLPIPYRAVATDMITGKMVVLDKGDIATAMRASMAIPGAFAPVVTGDYVLSDGGLVRNIPVDVARNLCADVVIVVNLVEPETTRDKLQTAPQLMGRMTDVMIIANEEQQLQSLTANDIRIDVIMGDIGTADFERVPETIPLGEAAARASADRLRTLALPTAQYAAWRGKITREQDIDARLADVRYTGLDRVNPEFLAGRAQVKPGDKVDTATISAEALRMGALQEFEGVEYRLTGDPKAPTLEWLPREKAWGPDYLKLDLGLYASEGGDLAFALYGKHTRTWINSLGAEWRNELQFGYYNHLSTSFYQPLDIAHTWFVEPRLMWSRSLEDLYVEGERTARYEFGDLGGIIDFGVNLNNRTQARLGYTYMQRKLEVATGPRLLPETKPDDAGIIASFTYDSRDTPFNPTGGMAVALEYLRSDTSLGADRDWDRIEAGVGMAVPVRRDVVWLTLAGGSHLDGDLPLDRAFAIGGPGSFPGYELGELRASDYWTASGSYLWKIKDLFALKGQALYAGLRLEAGDVSWARLESTGTGDGTFEFINDEVIYGASVYLTGRTQVGPLTVGFGATTTDAYSFWISVGRPIGQGTILERGIFR